MYVYVNNTLTPTVITVPLVIPGENLNPLITTLKLQSNTLQYSDWYTGR